MWNTWKHQITGAMTKFPISFVSAASIQSLTATQKTKPSSFCRTCTCGFFGFIHHVEVYLVFSCGWGEVAGCHPLVPVCSSAAFQWQFTGYTSHDLCIYLSLLEAGGTRSYNRLSSKGLCNDISIDVPWGGHAGVIVLRLHIWCRWGNANEVSKTRHPGCFKLMRQPRGTRNASPFLVTYIGIYSPCCIYSKMVNCKMYLLNLVIYQLKCCEICW